jgi:integrase
MAKRRGNSEGSIYQDRDGRWRASVHLGYRNGKRVRKVLNGATRAEVAAKLTAALRSKQLGIPLPSERQTVAEYLRGWLENVAKPSTRPKTFTSYEYITREHLIPSLGAKVLAKLGPQEVREFMKAKVDIGLSAKTVKHLRDTLRCALNVAVRDGILARNPAALVKPPRETLHAVTVLTQDQARQFLEAARGCRLEALFTVAICMGLREAEALGLRWEDVDFQSGTITVRYQLQRISGKLQLTQPKTEKSRRAIPMPAITRSALVAHLAAQRDARDLAGDRWVDSGLVFTTGIGTPLDQRNMLRDFYRLIKASNVPKIRFHDLRHSAATLLLAQGVHMKAVQEILGHSNFSTTANVYAHVLPSMKREAADRMDEVFAPVASSLASSSETTKKQ